MHDFLNGVFTAAWLWFPIIVVAGLVGIAYNVRRNTDNQTRLHDIARLCDHGNHDWRPRVPRDREDYCRRCRLVQPITDGFQADGA